MILCDTGPIVALLNRNDPAHSRCTETAQNTHEQFVTTQACLTEAMYLLGRDTGYTAITYLWRMIETDLLAVAETKSMGRVRELMDRIRICPVTMPTQLSSRLRKTSAFAPYSR